MGVGMVPSLGWFQWPTISARRGGGKWVLVSVLFNGPGFG